MGGIELISASVRVRKKNTPQIINTDGNHVGEMDRSVQYLIKWQNFQFFFLR